MKPFSIGGASDESHSSSMFWKEMNARDAALWLYHVFQNGDHLPSEKLILILFYWLWRMRVCDYIDARWTE